MTTLYKKLLACRGLDAESACAIAGAVQAARRKGDVLRVLRDAGSIMGGWGGVGVVVDPKLPVGVKVEVYYYSELLDGNLETLWARRRRLGFIWNWGVDSIVSLQGSLAREKIL